MHYVAIVDGRERQVEISEVSADRYQVVIDGRRWELDAQAISDSTLSVLHGDQAYNIESEQVADGGGNLLVRGHIVHVEVVDLRTLRLRKAQELAVGPDGPAEIRAPMPGRVVAVLVTEGQEVIEGQGLVVVEAMKMENELRSPKAGTIRNIKVSVGVAVEGGAPLCIVE